jgi:hypothetical protein
MSVGKKVDAVLKELEARLRGGQNYAAADHELLIASYEIFDYLTVADRVTAQDGGDSTSFVQILQNM